MSNVNNQFKELINEAIRNHFHDKTETEMILKDWLYGICEQADECKAKAKEWDKYKTHMESHIAGEVNEEEFVSDLKSDYFEGGEYDD